MTVRRISKPSTRNRKDRPPFANDLHEENLNRLPSPLSGTSIPSRRTIDDPNGSNSVVALVYGFQSGQTNVNAQFGYYTSFGIKGVSQDKLICQGKLSAGQKTCKQPIPGFAIGKRVLFQAAMRDTCPDTCMSNVLDMVVQ